MLKLKAYWYVLRLFIRCRGDGDLMLAEARRKIEEIRLDILTDSYWRGHDPPSP